MDTGVFFIRDIEAKKMNERLPAVAVLMSTYNGEKYLKEQLDSIFTQQGVVVKLFVRDDGSSDATIDILQAYAKKYPMEIIEDGENVRPGESFMRLVYKYADEPDYQYYAFADQDDIWMADKLQAGVQAIRKLKKTGPALYSSNQYIYIDGENKGLRHETTQRIDLISHMTKNTIAGCTYVFNKDLAQLVTKAGRPDKRIIKYRLHDAWLMLVAIACGDVIYDERSYMLYRIHGENAVGVKKTSFLKRLGRLKRYLVKRDDANLRMITAQELLRLFNEYILDYDTEILHLYADYQKNWKKKFALAHNCDINDNCLENKNVFKIKVLTNFI